MKLELGEDHPTSIRLHRALSWMQQVEQLGDECADTALVHHWIAFNALYGQWDENVCMPLPDRPNWREFLSYVVKLDADSHIGGMLTEQRDLVLKVLENEYLSRHFWVEPGDTTARQSRKARFDAPTWYLEQRWATLLDRLMDRIYLLRCQLVHGASTYGSRLNRDSLTECNLMLAHVLGAVLQVMITHGANEDWGPMCYPPLV